MASVDYWLRFGTDNPSNHTGLAPTFIKFLNSAGAATTAPAITEPGSAGLYKFSYDAQGTIAFIVDGNPTGVSLFGSDRFVVGSLNVSDKIAEVGGTLTALGATVVAIGNTVAVIGGTLAVIGSTISSFGVAMAGIGSTASTFGTDAADPVTLFGFMKRIQELQEGNSIYTKATGVWGIYSRGSSQLLRSKTIADSTSAVNKT